MSHSESDSSLVEVESLASELSSDQESTLSLDTDQCEPITSGKFYLLKRAQLPRHMYPSTRVQSFLIQAMVILISA